MQIDCVMPTTPHDVVSVEISDLDLAVAARALEVSYEVDLVVRRHSGLARSPRSSIAWVAVANRLWLAREDAAAVGMSSAIGTLTACMEDAGSRASAARRAGGLA